MAGKFYCFNLVFNTVFSLSGGMRTTEIYFTTGGGYRTGFPRPFYHRFFPGYHFPDVAIFPQKDNHSKVYFIIATGISDFHDTQYNSKRPIQEQLYKFFFQLSEYVLSWSTFKKSAPVIT